MEFQDVIRKRRMVRAFTQQPLDPEVVERLLRAANRAPSAGFSQGYAMLVLESAEDRAAFWKAAVGDGPEDDGLGAGWAVDPTRVAPLIVIP